MSYIKITNGTAEPYSVGKLRRDNNNVSFPKRIPDHLLADYGVYPVVTAARPSYSTDTQVCTVNTEATEVNGRWTYGRTLRAKTAEELAAGYAGVADRVREQRTELLLASDWTQVADSTVDRVIWASYRTLLRDVTEQAGFPLTIVWPTNPEDL